MRLMKSLVQSAAKAAHSAGFAMTALVRLQPSRLATGAMLQKGAPTRAEMRCRIHMVSSPDKRGWDQLQYTPNYSHLVGIMISKTIGFRGTNHFQTHPNRYILLQPTCHRLP